MSNDDAESSGAAIFFSRTKRRELGLKDGPAICGRGAVRARRLGTSPRAGRRFGLFVVGGVVAMSQLIRPLERGVEKVGGWKRRVRRASITIEALVGLPILIFLTFGVFQFAGALAIEQAVSHAAVVGAREAGKGATNAEIETAVEAALAPYGIVAGPQASLLIERFGFASVTIGALPIAAPASPALVIGESRVTVSASLGVSPLSRLLSNFGVDFSTRQVTFSSLVVNEI